MRRWRLCGCWCVHCGWMRRWGGRGRRRVRSGWMRRRCGSRSWRMDGGRCLWRSCRMMTGLARVMRCRRGRLGLRFRGERERRCCEKNGCDSKANCHGAGPFETRLCGAIQSPLGLSDEDTLCTRPANRFAMLCNDFATSKRGLSPRWGGNSLIARQGIGCCSGLFRRQTKSFHRAPFSL